MCKQNIKFNLRDIVERVFFLSCIYITTHSSTPGSLLVYICHESCRVCVLHYILDGHRQR